MKKYWFLIILFLFSILHAEESKDLYSMLEDARKGDVEAMCDLGIAYFNGNKTLKDPFKAKCWIKKAYDNDSPRAKKLWADLELWRYSGKCENSFDDEHLPRFAKADTYQDPVTKMQFVFVPKGCFVMGCYPLSKKCKKDEKPSHLVCLDGFWLGKYEVTRTQWNHIMESNPSGFSMGPDHPVENVSFNDIERFILILNSKTRHKFSLPTEAQWEYAGRNGGENISFPWGNESFRPQANCGSCNSGDFTGQTSPVGSFPPSELGLYDMAGNVKEWCKDIYHKKAYSEHTKNNPLYEGKGNARVVRGGAFTDNTSKLRSTARDKSIPGIQSNNIGFRLVLIRND